MPKVTTVDDIRNMEGFTSFSINYNVPPWLYTQPLSDPPDDMWKTRERIRMYIERNQSRRIANILGAEWYDLAGDIEERYFGYLADDGLNIAFTPSDEFGRADRQLVMKMGRFLARFMGLEDNENIKEITSQWRFNTVPPDLIFTTDPDQIKWVYDHGPSSCMGQKEFPHQHPCEVYAGPDTELCYIMDRNNEYPSARVVIRRDRGRREYVNKIYGDGTRLLKALQANDIQPSPDGLLGARLLKIPYSGSRVQLIGAYLDGGYNGIKSIPGDDELVEVCAHGGESHEWIFKQTSGIAKHKNARNCRTCRHAFIVGDGLYPVDRGASQICLSCLINHDLSSLGLRELITQGGEIQLVTADQGFRYHEYMGQLYTRNALDEHDLVIIDDVVCNHNDERLVRCVATGRLRLRERCVQLEDGYYSELDETIANLYPQLTLGRLLESPEDSDDITIGAMYEELIEQYGVPLINAEIRANTHPNIHPALLTLFRTSSEQGRRFVRERIRSNAPERFVRPPSKSYFAI